MNFRARACVLQFAPKMMHMHRDRVRSVLVVQTVELFLEDRLWHDSSETPHQVFQDGAFTPRENQRDAFDFDVSFDRVKTDVACLQGQAERTAGAHPANATPEHAAQARAIIGPNALLAPVHNVVLTSDAEEARAVGRTALATYLNLTNYVSNWKRLGFTDADVTPPGSDNLIDAVIAHGTADDVANRLREYLSSGADHVAILVHGGSDKALPTLSELAGPLGLSR